MLNEYSRYLIVSRYGLLPMVALLFLSSCQLGRVDRALEDPYLPTHPSSYYLEQTRARGDGQSTVSILLAARALLLEGEIQQADNQIQLLTDNLPQEQLVEKRLLEALSAYKKRSYAEAEKYLHQLDPTELLRVQQIRYHELLQLITRATGAILAETRSLIALSHLLQTGQEKSNSAEQIWQRLSQLSSQQETMPKVDRESEPELHGWLSIVEIYEKCRNNRQRLEEVVAQWCRQNPSHPAALHQPKALAYRLHAEPLLIHKIALFLPLSGPNKALGEAIRQGFIDSVNGVHLTTTPEPEPLAGMVRVTHPGIIPYDTASAPLDQLVREASADGASAIVGPLLKPDVTTIGQLKVRIPILALNAPDDPSSSSNRICYYGLSPKDEAAATAQHIWRQGKKFPLVLAPKNDLGSRIAEAFLQEWEKIADGTLAKVGYFGQVEELKRAINRRHGNEDEGEHLTGIAKAIGVEKPEDPEELDKPEGLEKPEEPGRADKLEITPLRDIDAIYLVANPEEITILKSMVDLIIENGSRKPNLYAGSRSFMLNPDPDFKLEMEGVQFGDIPFMTGQENELIRRRTSLFFRYNDNLMRFYAIGLDAWWLIQQFDELQRAPDFKLLGATGVLRTDLSCRVKRDLSWVRYSKGQILKVPPTGANRG